MSTRAGDSARGDALTRPARVWARLVGKGEARQPEAAGLSSLAAPVRQASPSPTDASDTQPEGAAGDAFARERIIEASSGEGSTDEADDEDDSLRPRPAVVVTAPYGPGHSRRTSTLLPALRLPLYRPSSRIDGSATAKPRTAASSNSHFYDTPRTAMPQDAPAVVRTRRHLRVRVITWNMHDNLPMGDLTELLGKIPDSAYEANSPTLGSASDVPQLGDSLDADGLYHIIVVGGQEAPGGGVTAGGVTVPTASRSSGAQWIDVLDGYLARGDINAARQPRVRQQSANETLNSASTTSTASIQTPSSVHTSPFAATKGPPPSGGRTAPPLTPIPGSIIRRDFAATETDEHGMSPPLATPGLEASKPLPALPQIRPRGSIDSLRSQKSFEMPATPARTGAAFQQTSPAPTGPYVLVAKERLMGIFACVYVLRSCRSLVGGFDKGRVTTGLVGGRVGNKGCAAISLKFAGQRMLFVVAHLAAHTGGLPLRMANVLKIKDELFVDDFTASPSALRRSGTSATAIPTKHSSRSSGGPLRDVTSQFDYTIWLGDLNFRTAISRLHADWLLQKRDYMTMLQFDELRNLMAGPDNVFNGFVEAPIEFAPTYKYDVLALRRKPTIRRATSTALRRSNTATSAVAMVATSSTTSESDAIALPSDSAPVSSRASFSSTASERAEMIENLSATVTTTPKVVVSPSNGLEDAPPTPSPNIRSRARFFGANRTQSSATVVARPPPLSLNTSAASSVTSFQDGVEPSSPNRLQALRCGDQDAVFDSSKKQRVQSWTDRILVRSTVAQPDPPDAEPSTLQRRLGSLVDSLKLGATASRRSVSGTSPMPSPVHRPSVDELALGRIASARSDVSSSSARSRLRGFNIGARLREARGRRVEEKPAPMPRRRESESLVSPTLHPHAPPPTPVTPVRLVARPSPNGLKLVAEPRRPSTSPAAPTVRRMSGAEAEQLVSPIGSQPPSPTQGRPRAQSDSPARVVFTPPSPVRETSESAISPSFLRPQRSRSSVHHGPSPSADNPFSFRTWWSQHVPAAFGFSSSAVDDDAEPVRPMAQPSGAPTWVGPKRGEVQTLLYQSINDLRRLGAETDHRPVVGVFAFGLGGDDEDA